MPLRTVHLQAQHGHAQACLQVQTAHKLGENPASIADFIQYAVYREALSAQEQIRAVPLGFLQCRGAPPIGDFRVVSADQNFGHFPTTKIGRPRVMRKIQQEMVCYLQLATLFAHDRVGPRL